MKRMMNLSSKVFDVGQLVLVTCASTLATAKACLQLSQSNSSVGCEKESARFRNALPSLVAVWAKLVLGSNCILSESEEKVRQASYFQKRWQLSCRKE